MEKTEQVASSRKTSPGDHRRKPRRRGDELQHAIYEATVAALSEYGYGNLTMHDVAKRAKTSKAALYRRWSTRAELVVDAVRHVFPERGASTDTGELRGDLIALLRNAAELLNGPVGSALRGLLADSLRDPELAEAARSRLAGSAPDRMMRILRRAADRGEADASALTQQVANAGPALLRHHFLVYGTPIPEQVIIDVVDEVIVPLVSPQKPDRST